MIRVRVRFVVNVGLFGFFLLCFFFGCLWATAACGEVIKHSIFVEDHLDFANADLHECRTLNNHRKISGLPDLHWLE